MKTRRLLLPLLIAPLLLTGCVSARYKAAPKATPPAVRVDLVASQSSATLRLDSVIVFKGPGSWKREAYWDEYIVTVTNSGDSPLVIDGFSLRDRDEMSVAPVEDPWELESLSRLRLRQRQGHGDKILLGAGTVVWAASPIVGLGAAMGGAGTAATLSTTVFVAGPVLLIGSGVARYVARKDIEQEFARRRWPDGVAIAPGESRTGSLFLPVTPAPASLDLRFQSGGTTNRLALPLDHFARLHLAPTPPPPPPAPTTDQVGRPL